MGESTKIQWAHHTFNPWRGCQKIAPGCANCYADAQSKRNPKTLGIWGPSGTRVVASEAMWREPVNWSKAAACRCNADGHCSACLNGPPRVFCASLADVFEDWRLPVINSRGDQLFVHEDGVMDCEPHGRQANLDDVRARLFRLIDATPNLDWLLLTKRPENVRRMWQPYEWHACVSGDCPHDVASECDPNTGFRENVWLGTSISCQEDAERNIPELLKCSDLCAKTFLSIEPLIGPVSLTRWFGPQSEGEWLNTVECGHSPNRYGVNWVIVGGESGPNARRCDIAWIRSIVRQCRDAGVPCFVKQLGSFCIDNDSDCDCGTPTNGWPSKTTGVTCTEGLKIRLLDPKGGDQSEWPEDVRVREVPISTPA